MDVTERPPDRVLAQLETIDLEAGRPVFAVDVDEVIVGLAADLTEYAAQTGFALRLTEYRLDGALWRADGTEASREEFGALMQGYFATRTRHQRPWPGAAEALAALSQRVQIVIVTNVPFAAREDRVANLADHGITYPLIANSGPKGPLLRLLSEMVGGMAFVDDSPVQLASARDHAPQVETIHFVGDEMLRGFLADVPAARHRAEDWPGIRRIVEGLFP